MGAAVRSGLFSVAAAGAIAALLVAATLAATGVGGQPDTPGAAKGESRDVLGPTPRVACGPVTGTIYCGTAITGTTVGATNYMSSYDCSSWSESGGEHVYTLVPPGSDTWTVTAALSDLTADLDVFILGPWTCDSSLCLAYGDTNATLDTAAGGTTYYVVVDGYSGAAGPYRLDIGCGVSPGTLNGSVYDIYVNPQSPPCGVANVHVEPGGIDIPVDYQTGAYGPVGLPAGTYDLTASAYGYAVNTATGVQIWSGMTTTQDFGLSRPWAVPSPLALFAVSYPGYPFEAWLDIENPGWPELSFEMSEDGGDIPWVSESPITGTIPSAGHQWVEVTFDCPDLTYHESLLTVTSNDPCHPAYGIPIHLNCVQPIFADGFESGNTWLWSYTQP
jgi:hypothetical protein